jgi:hypothetical protein
VQNDAMRSIALPSRCNGRDQKQKSRCRFDVAAIAAISYFGGSDRRADLPITAQREAAIGGKPREIFHSRTTIDEFNTQHQTDNSNPYVQVIPIVFLMCKNIEVIVFDTFVENSVGTKAVSNPRDAFFSPQGAKKQKTIDHFPYMCIAFS